MCVRSRILKFSLLLVIWTAAGVHVSQGQVSPSLYDYPRSGLDWYTLETPHFNIIFHADSAGKGSSRTAQAVARIAEEIYGPITSLYEYEPDTRVSFVLKDFEDYSNGAAYFFDNKIEIWAPALDSPLRGDHNWLRNVITHEFTHIIQVQKTMKMQRRLPFLYFQFLDYEDVKRPDVLYGYPDKIVTYPVPILNNPAWFAEGTAQYQRTGLHYDTWDTHRDMLLRTRVLAGKELSLEEMGGFYSHNSLMREGVYNHGFALTRYLASTYGESSLREISEALARWKNWNIERAIKDAIGVDGDKVYSDWMRTLRDQYETNTRAIRAEIVEGEILEPEGFQNFYPRFSPDGKQLAYVSNRKEDFSRSSLYIRDLESGEVVVYDLEGFAGSPFTYTCSLGHRIVTGVSGAFDWSPDGTRIVYARVRDTAHGYLYSDLYEYDLDSRKSSRLTIEQRAASPAYAPDGKQIVFVGQGDGTSNLFLFDRSTEEIVPITEYVDGTQVTDPTWHPSGDWIYFARFDGKSRDVLRIRPDGSGQEVVIGTGADERSPAFDAAGSYLYFSSDQSGIFNLYRISVDKIGEIEPERLTNVLGGAFMPEVSPSGSDLLAYAHYQWDGYKIALLKPGTVPPEGAPALVYEPPSVTQKQEELLAGVTDWSALNDASEGDVRSLSPEALSRLRSTGSVPLEAQEEGTLEAGKYRNLFTSFSFFPVLRLDQYVSRDRSRLDARLGKRSVGETLLRNTKIGTYVTSREILEGLSLLGGIMFSPGSAKSESIGDFFSPSSLLSLERDLFLQFEYKKGFKFLPQRWAPQLALELYNIRRNVENGLSIEEFPCTSCFPDTTFADLSYNLWEADLIARSKINRGVMLEGGCRFSPYRVTTERFFSRESNQSVDPSSSRYYIGRTFWVKTYLEALHPYRDSDVVPDGLLVEASFEYEPGRLLEKFDIEDGLLVPRYQQFKNQRLTLDTRFGMRLPGSIKGGSHGLGVRLRASSILGGEVDNFFNDYVGGLIGARGYPFYALGGNETLWFQAAYHFPVLPSVHKQLLFTFVDKVYARVYADAALAWSGAWPGLGETRKDIGAELRFGLGSFYLLPTALFVSASYGLDSFDYQLDEGFLTPDGKSSVRYGNEMLWHFGVLFSFDP